MPIRSLRRRSTRTESIESTRLDSTRPSSTLRLGLRRQHRPVPRGRLLRVHVLRMLREHVHERDSMCTDATLTWTSLCARASATCACIAGRRRCTFSLGTSTTLRHRSWCASTKCALTSTTLPSFSMFAPHPRACALLLAFGVSRCFTFEPLLCVQKEA